MELQNIKQEGEIYSNEARVQLVFFSYMKIVLIMTITWAAVDLIIGLFTVRGTGGTNEPGIFVYVWATFMYVGLGFARALFCGVVSYPLYKWWCERHRGQRMSGKFAVIISK